MYTYIHTHTCIHTHHFDLLWFVLTCRTDMFPCTLSQTIPMLRVNWQRTAVCVHYSMYLLLDSTSCRGWTVTACSLLSRKGTDGSNSDAYNCFLISSMCTFPQSTVLQKHPHHVCTPTALSLIWVAIGDGFQLSRHLPPTLSLHLSSHFSFPVLCFLHQPLPTGKVKCFFPAR